MKQLIIIIQVFLFAIFLVGCSEPAPPDNDIPLVENPASLVNPTIGSGGLYFRYGATFPGASLPHGMAKPGPDTTGELGTVPFHHLTGYHYDDTIVHGFSQVHINGIGLNDYGALLLKPTSGFNEDKTNEDGYRSPFSKANEIAEPGYYSITLNDNDDLDDNEIKVELTATQRCS